MPWQQQVADVGLELLPDGLPAYREVTFTVPRQSGKTTLILAWEVQRALGWAEILGMPQRIAYSAQTGKDARQKLLEDQVPLLESRKRLLGIQSVTRANGSESIHWRNGSILSVLASSEEAGHGRTIDLGVKDELFADSDMRRDQALNPAMATRAHAQALTASTMGTDESHALNRAVEKGRAAVEADTGSGVAYFEWSADEGDDPGSPDVWARCMPALGRTVSLQVVEHAFQSLPIGEFRRAYLNIPTVSDERVIPLGAWGDVCSATAEADPGVFAFDVSPERSAAGIVAVGDGPTVEVVDYRPGTGWLVERIEELHRRYGRPFAVDRHGPAGNIADELLLRHIPLMELKPAEVVRASGAFYDAVLEGRVTVRQNYDLDAAVAGASKRSAGDAWGWGRKSSSVDISLLVAASIGLWAHSMPAPSPAAPEAFLL